MENNLKEYDRFITMLSEIIYDEIIKKASDESKLKEASFETDNEESN